MQHQLDFDNDRLQLEEAALFYLDETKQLESLTEECIAQRKTKQVTIYSFVVRITCALITEVNANLGNLVLHQPQEARKIFQEVCYIAFNRLHLLPSEVSCSQVLVSLLMSDLPNLPSYQITTSELLGCKFKSRFYKFVGTVCSVSTPTSYTRCAKYRCPEAGCRGAVDNLYIRCHIEGAKEHQTVRRDFNCVYCGSILMEDMQCRILGERVSAQMVEGSISSVLSSDKDCFYGRCSQTITVVLRDTFLDVIQLGGHYCIIGIPVLKFTGNAAVTVMIEANNVYEIQPRIFRTPSYQLPQTLDQLLTYGASSPWSFSANLAYQFAADVAPPGTYHQLKLCMLLSLIDAASRSSKNDSDGFLDLAAVGMDSNIIHRLLLHGASLAPQSVVHNSSQPLYESLSRNSQASVGCYNVDGGSLLLAHRGICMLGDLDCLKQDVREKLQNVIEKRVISVECQKSSLRQQQVFPVQCNLWGYANYPKCQDAGHDVLCEASNKKTNMKHSLVESFSMVLVCDSHNSSMNEHAEMSIIQQTLLRSMEDQDAELIGNDSVISQDEMKEFLEHISKERVEFSVAAKQLLKGYFVGSRRLRSSGVQCTSFPPMALQTLACMSKALAKLNLRNQVLIEDLALAVLLYEESVTARYGHSVLNIQPKPHIRDENVSEHLGQANDAFMRSFLHQLIRFCHSHVPDLNLHLSED